MKNNTSDDAGFGVFSFAARRAVTEGAPGTSFPAAPVWDKALDRKPGPVYIYRHLIKRLFDLAFVVLTLPFSALLIALCAVALWIEGGNPFYTQERLGKSGVRFRILKLRTMVRDADAVLEDFLAKDPEMRREWDEMQKLRNDPRITPVGSILRKTSLDELPQLANVFLGQMSLVGPRPMMPDQLSLYGDATAYNALQPGITGLWQVSARNEERFSYRAEVDADYEATLTLKRDLDILVKTIGVVLRPTGH